MTSSAPTTPPLVPRPIVLIVFASAHGSTRRVAEAIAATVRASSNGSTVVLCDASDAGAVAAAVALAPSVLVVGSAMHHQQWLPEAEAFVERCVAAPNGPLLSGSSPRILAFTVCSVGDTTSFLGSWVSAKVRQLRPDADSVRSVRLLKAAAGPERFAGHRFFAGAVETEHWGLLGSAFVWATGGSLGDHVDLEDVRSWAASVARCSKL